MVRCTYLSLEVSVNGDEGVVLGGKVQIHLLQRGLGGRGPGDGRHWEDVDSNLKLSVHCIELAEDAAGQLGEHQREAEFLVLVPGGREEGDGVLVVHAGAEPLAPLIQVLGGGVNGVTLDADVDHGGGGALCIPRHGIAEQFFDLLHHALFGGRPRAWRPEIRIFLRKVGGRRNDGFHEMLEITLSRD